MNPQTLFTTIFGPARESHVAVLYEQREITYAELREETIRAAEVLNTLGIEQGDRIAIFLHDSPEFIASFIAICSLGAIAVPINMGLRADEQLLILNDCTARAAIIEAEACNTLTGASERLRFLDNVLVVVRDGELSLPTSAGLNVTLFADGPRKPIEDFPVSRAAEAPAFILYTSGSTGDPKGAVHRASDISYTNETFCAEVLRLQPDDRLFSSSRLPFAYGLGNSFSFPLLNGVTTVLCRAKPAPDLISRVLREYQPTIFFGVPVVYNLLLDYHRHSQALDCSSLRLCISAGEALPAHLGEEWEATFGVEVLDGIGSTEMLHMWMSNHAGAVRYGSSGKLLQGYEAQLLDEHRNPTPTGVAGHLWVKGNSAALGYWSRPDVTARTFVDGWVHTGDLYRRDAEDYWYHMGRSDDCFKSSGQWVSPVEVEGVLLRCPGVSRAAVVEDFDEDELPCACAFVVGEAVESDAVELEGRLRQLTKASLPRFKRPRRYVFVTDLPYTATGKVQRFKLREQLKKVPSPMSNAQRPATNAIE